MTKKTCCTGDCNQGRDCPLRAKSVMPVEPREIPTLRDLAELFHTSAVSNTAVLVHPASARRLFEAMTTPQSSGNSRELSTPRATADVERVAMDCLIALSIGYVHTNEEGNEVCADCDVDHVGTDHSPGCLVLRARAARAQLDATNPGKPI